ncbi:MAG: tetratricopeptide repeat protein [Bacteroidota bacterium]
MSRKNKNNTSNIKQEVKPKSVKQNNKNNIKPENSKFFWILLFIPIIITWITYFGALKNGFVSWDDEGYIHENLKVIGNFSTEGWSYIFSNNVMANYHPITIMVYNFIYHFFKLNPYPYHFFNVLFHLINTGLVFYFIYKLSNKKLLVGFITALLFGIHPLHVESVAWIAETKDVLYTFFFLLSLIAYHKYDNQKANIKYYLFALVLFVLSCMSKGMAVSLSVVLVLIDYLKNKKFTKEIIIEKIPFFFISIIFGIIAIKAQQAADGFYNLSNYTIFQKILFPFYAVIFYIYKMVMPVNLAIIYPYPFILTFEYFLAPILLIALVFVAYFTRKFTNKIIFGLLFFGACIAPIIQILPVGQAIASDRYFYVSSIGLFFLVAEGFYYLYNEKFSNSFANRSIMMVLGVAICVVFISNTNNRIKTWNNTLTLWTELGKTNPFIDKAWYGAGLFLQRQNDLEKAKYYYNKALEVNPNNIKALNNLGNCLYNTNKIDSAYTYYQRLLALDTNFIQVYHNVGNIYVQKNQLDKAEKSYLKAISLDKNFAISYYGLAIIYMIRKDQKKSNEYFIKSAQLGYGDAKKALTQQGIKF